jgi:DNA invertase Pin-like site-specific DNA recombinase
MELSVKKDKKALGYIRVSTDGQARDGVSLEAQKDKIRRWADDHGYELEGIVEDAGISGKAMKNRPGLQQVLARVRRGGAVVVYSLSRLARSTRDTIAIADDLEKRGVDLVSLTEALDTTSAAGRMLFRLLAVLGEFERDLISERTSLALRHLQRQGRYIGGRVPFGFSRAGQLVRKNSKEQAVVRLAHELRAAGHSYQKTSRVLAEQGHMNRKGKPFGPFQIQRMTSRVDKAAQPPRPSRGLRAGDNL